MSERDHKPRREGGLSFQTLLISSLSAVVATVVVSQFWERGTLIFTALVPVMVAVLSEALKRPVEQVARVAPLVTPLRATAPGGTAIHPAAGRAEATPGDDEAPTVVAGPGGPLTGWDALDAPTVANRDAGARGSTRRTPPPLPARHGRLGSRAVRIGLITGLIACVIGGGVVTASELALLGGSVGSSQRRTTLLGGKTKRSKPKKEKATPTPTATGTPQATVTQGPQATPTATPKPAATVTPAPSASPTVAPAATPTATLPDAPPPADPAAP